MDEALTAVAEAQAMPAGGEQQTNTADNAASDVETEGAAAEAEGAEGQEGEGEAEPELVEVDYDGKKHKIPAELKDALLRQQDYTRKTQEVAEERKVVEAKRAEADQIFQTSQEVIEAKAHIHHLDSQLKQYEGVNWQQLENEDPMAAMSHWRNYQTLKEERGQVAGYLTHTTNELSEKAKLDTANRLRETRAFAEKSIPGWTEDMDKKITDFALGKGFTREALQNAYSPQTYEILFLAHLGHQAMMQKTAQPKPNTTIAPKPLETVAAKASAGRVPPEKMGMDDFAKWINKR
ncbi:hypothetical protein [Rhizobium leguminosarum]|uniref:hypothetical protein n=1 Tax=Rhizobium leguminosarum TaxID=384 RepID=UPI000B92C7D5|nr:hypothetical protein [Rhizobium leguminosarum]ASS55905.1 hypothetical protein CHR56_15775 [Rhizobium leguminosarum bv. viciae]